MRLKNVKPSTHPPNQTPRPNPTRRTPQIPPPSFLPTIRKALSRSLHSDKAKLSVKNDINLFQSSPIVKCQI